MGRQRPIRPRMHAGLSTLNSNNLNIRPCSHLNAGASILNGNNLNAGDGSLTARPPNVSLPDLTDLTATTQFIQNIHCYGYDDIHALLREAVMSYTQRSEYTLTLFMLLKQNRLLDVEDLRKQHPTLLDIIEGLDKDYNRNHAYRCYIGITNAWGVNWPSEFGLSIRNDIPKHRPFLRAAFHTSRLVPNLEEAVNLVKESHRHRVGLRKPGRNALYTIDFYNVNAELVASNATQPETVNHNGSSNEAVNSTKASRKRKRAETGNNKTSNQTCNNETTNDDETSNKDRAESETSNNRTPNGTSDETAVDDLWPLYDDKESIIQTTEDGTIITLHLSLLEIQAARAPTNQSSDPCASTCVKTQACTCDSWRRKLASWDTAVQALDLIRGNVLIVSSDKKILAQKLSGALSNADNLHERFQQLRSTWVNKRVNKSGNVVSNSLPQPYKGDRRHHDADEMAHRYGKDKCGVFHFAWWVPRGQKRKGPVMSQDFGQGYRREAVMNFLHSTDTFQRVAANMLQSEQPELWQRYTEVMRLARSKHWSLSALGPDARFFGMALVHNLRVLPHRDSGDDPLGFVAMTPLGKFTGGDLVLGYEGGRMHRLEYQPGDVILFRSAIIQHAIGSFEGDRTALVLFSHKDVLESDWEPWIPETVECAEEDVGDARLRYYFEYRGE
jgi:hypothetical protein